MDSSRKQPAHPDLLAEIDALISAKHFRSRSEVGQKWMRDPRFVFDLERGRELRRVTERKVRDKIAAVRRQTIVEAKTGAAS